MYLPNAYDGGDATQISTNSSMESTKRQKSSVDTQLNSPLSRASGPDSRRLHPPPLNHLFGPPQGARSSNRSNFWEDSFGSFRDNHDNINLESWPTQPSGSQSTSDIFTGGHNTSTGPFTGPPSWFNRSTDAQRNTTPSSDGVHRRQDKQIVVALRDDQLGQIIHAISPPKTVHNLSLDRGAQHGYMGRPPPTQLFNPFTGFVPHTGRPSLAALARKSSYPGHTAVQRSRSSKSLLDEQETLEVRKTHAHLTSHPSATSNKENFPPSQTRIPTPWPYANRVPTPNPFAPMAPQWKSGIYMTEGASNTTAHPLNPTSRTPVLSEVYNKHGAAHVPSNSARVKGRKEGMAFDTRIPSERRTRHDQSLLPPASGQLATSREHRPSATSTPNMLPKSRSATVEIIDVDALDPEPEQDSKTPSHDATKLSTDVSRHKQGMSSVNSLGSVERKVITYVGAEVSRAASNPRDNKTMELGREEEQDVDEDTDTIVLPLGGRAFETAAKRKRMGTVDGEAMRKREKGEQDDVDVHGELDVNAEDEELPTLMGV